jgi:hypothetical protein
MRRRHRVQAVHGHAPRNAAHQRVGLVQRQVVPRVLMQQRQDGVQRRRGRVRPNRRAANQRRAATPAMLVMRSGISAGSATMSTQPAPMALLGMESNCADLGLCASVSPPCDLIACRPSVPSDPMPDSTTPMALSPSSRAPANRTTRRSAAAAHAARPAWPGAARQAHRQFGIGRYHVDRVGLDALRLRTPRARASRWRAAAVRSARPCVSGPGAGPPGRPGHWPPVLWAQELFQRASSPPADAPSPTIRTTPHGAGTVSQAQGASFMLEYARCLVIETARR